MKILLILLILNLLSCYNGYAQTNWTKYGNEPILKRDTVINNLPNDLIAISDCWVLNENGIYKMWYTCGGFNYPADTAMRARMCYATSTDGISWNKFAGNPIMDVSYNGAWDSLGIETATVIIDELAPLNERYKMWYAGQYFNSYRYDIGYATSPNGLSWTKHPTPVMQVGSGSEWDNGFLEGPSVIKDGSTYKMWYCGYDVTVNGSSTDGKANIGYATSTDGINWIKQTNPVLQTEDGAWDAVYVQDPHVIKDNGVYHMWYGGNDTDSYGQKVGYATSNDGITWVKDAANPVLANGMGGSWDANTASFPSVLIENTGYKMWYTGKDTDPTPANSLDYYWEIGYATGSLSGLNDSDLNVVECYPNPVSDELNIVLEKDQSNLEMEVFDIDGSKILTQNYSNVKTISLTTNNWPQGLYMIHLKDEQSNSIVMRVVK